MPRIRVLFKDVHQGSWNEEFKFCLRLFTKGKVSKPRLNSYEKNY